MSILFRTLSVAACVAALAAPAHGGGDNYDAMNDTKGKGPAYFGFVRDHRGSPVSRCRRVRR